MTASSPFLAIRPERWRSPICMLDIGDESALQHLYAQQPSDRARRLDVGSSAISIQDRQATAVPRHILSSNRCSYSAIRLEKRNPLIQSTVKVDYRFLEQSKGKVCIAISGQAGLR